MSKRGNGVIPGDKKNSNANTWGNDEQAAANRKISAADAKLLELMFVHHRNRYTTTTRPGTESPRFVSHRPLPISRGGSPADLCADHGIGELRGTHF